MLRLRRCSGTAIEFLLPGGAKDLEIGLGRADHAHAADMVVVIMAHDHGVERLQIDACLLRVFGKDFGSVPSVEQTLLAAIADEDGVAEVGAVACSTGSA